MNHHLPDIEFKKVSRHFWSVKAVNEIDLTIPQGTYCCLLWPSGCGKSTTLRMIAGHESVTSGEIWVCNENVTYRQPSKRNTAMMFQDYALFPI